MKAGHFSAKIPGQLSAEINIPFSQSSDEGLFYAFGTRGSLNGID